MESRFCVECREFLDKKQFAAENHRTLCRVHANQMAKQSRLRKWVQDPLVRKAHELWQVAYADSSRTFKVMCGISQGCVLALLQRHQFSFSDELRLVPVNPTEPVSINNYCFTSIQNKTDMCRVWRKLHCVRDYMLFISPEMKRPVYGTSTTSQIESEVAVVDQTCNVSRMVVCV